MKHRIRELDGIRGIAILMVLIFHYFGEQHKEIVPVDVGSFLLLITGSFWTGVDLFFVLSGFLIGGIILDNHDRNSFLKVFWIRRTCRIFPVLFLLLLVCWATGAILDKAQFSWLYHNFMPWWTYATFTQNIAMGLEETFGSHFVGITWSLAVEEQFYLFAPLIVLAIGSRRWIQSLVPLIILAFILRLVFPGFHTYVNTIFRMDSLLSGVLVAAIFRHEATWKILRSNRATMLYSFLILLTLTAVLVYRRTLGTFEFSWFAIVSSLFLVVALLYPASKLTSILRTRFLCFFGAIAYGMYMYHQAVSGLLHGWLRPGQAPSTSGTNAALITLLAVVVTTSAAWLSFKFFESYFLKIGQSQKYGTNKIAPSTTISSEPDR